MNDDSTDFVDWLGRSHDDPRLVTPDSVIDAVRYVFWKYGYLLVGLLAFGLATYYVVGVEGGLVFVWQIALLVLAVVVGSSAAFDQRLVTGVAVTVAVAVVVGGVVWGTSVLGPGTVLPVLLATLVFGGLVAYYTHQRMSAR